MTFASSSPVIKKQQQTNLFVLNRDPISWWELPFTPFSREHFPNKFYFFHESRLTPSGAAGGAREARDEAVWKLYRKQ